MNDTAKPGAETAALGLLRHYVVTIGYGELGVPENHFLGEWKGVARTDEEAHAKAMESVWDYRLDVTASPRVDVVPGRLVRSEAVRLIEALLDKEKPGCPQYTMIEDGETGWAFWIVPDDTTSYVRPDGAIQWSESAWPDDVSYDGDTGNFLPKLKRSEKS